MPNVTRLFWKLVRSLIADGNYCFELAYCDDKKTTQNKSSDAERL